MCETLLVALKNIELETTNSELAKTCQHVLVSAEIAVFVIPSLLKYTFIKSVHIIKNIFRNH